MTIEQFSIAIVIMCAIIAIMTHWILNRKNNRIRLDVGCYIDIMCYPTEPMLKITRVGGVVDYMSFKEKCPRNRYDYSYKLVVVRNGFVVVKLTIDD